MGQPHIPPVIQINWRESFRNRATTTTLLYSRLLDIFFALLGCLVVLVIMPGLWLLNRLFAPGPLFYSQTRIGRGGVPFTIIKFRSMIVGAEATGITWATADDQRITPIGAFLRRAHIDELPQSWNILRGEMSLIGPRPERPEFVSLLTEQIYEYARRHLVKPGLTGWAQVNYGYGGSVEGARMKLVYDLEYIRCRSWRLDLEILWRTCGMLWRGR